MYLRAQLFLFCFMSEVVSEECGKLWKMMIFSIFSQLDPFSQDFGLV